MAHSVPKLKTNPYETLFVINSIVPLGHGLMGQTTLLS